MVNPSLIGFQVYGHGQNRWKYNWNYSLQITVPGIQVPFCYSVFWEKKHFILYHTVDAHPVFFRAELCNRKERKSDFCKGRFKIGNTIKSRPRAPPLKSSSRCLDAGWNTSSIWYLIKHKIKRLINFIYFYAWKLIILIYWIRKSSFHLNLFKCRKETD